MRPSCIHFHPWQSTLLVGLLQKARTVPCKRRSAGFDLKRQINAKLFDTAGHLTQQLVYRPRFSTLESTDGVRANYGKQLSSSSPWRARRSRSSDFRRTNSARIREPWPSPEEARKVPTCTAGRLARVRAARSVSDGGGVQDGEASEAKSNLAAVLIAESARSQSLRSHAQLAQRSHACGRLEAQARAASASAVASSRRPTEPRSPPSMQRSAPSATPAP